MANSGGITCYTFLKQNFMEILKKFGPTTRKIVEVQKKCFPAKFWAYTGKSGFGLPNNGKRGNIGRDVVHSNAGAPN